MVIYDHLSPSSPLGRNVAQVSLSHKSQKIPACPPGQAVMDMFWPNPQKNRPNKMNWLGWGTPWRQGEFQIHFEPIFSTPNASDEKTA